MIAGILVLCLFIGSAYAGDFGMGVHAGYGTAGYKERTSALGVDVESESIQPVFLTGFSVEYTFRRKLFINLTTDLLFGREGNERWSGDGVEIQENDMRISGQFYDLRFGYKDDLNNVYYRVYISGGWDGLSFKRDVFRVDGMPAGGSVEEDFSLIRMGIGAGAGYKLNKRWAIDGRAAYSYYPYARVENTALPDFDFRIHGTCLDEGLGVTYQISDRLSLYAGFSYTLLRLDESDVIEKGSVMAVFPASTTEIRTGMLNLTYMF